MRQDAWAQTLPFAFFTAQLISFCCRVHERRAALFVTQHYRVVVHLSRIYGHRTFCQAINQRFVIAQTINIRTSSVSLTSRTKRILGTQHNVVIIVASCHSRAFVKALAISPVGWWFIAANGTFKAAKKIEIYRCFQLRGRWKDFVTGD